MGDDTPPLFGSLLFESEQTTGYFLSRANVFRTRRLGMSVADFKLPVVCGEARHKVGELFGDRRVHASKFLGELVPLGDN